MNIIPPSALHIILSVGCYHEQGGGRQGGGRQGGGRQGGGRQGGGRQGGGRQGGGRQGGGRQHKEYFCPDSSATENYFRSLLIKRNVE